MLRFEPPKRRFFALRESALEPFERSFGYAQKNLP